MNFIEELKWRGMLHDIMPGTEEQLQKEITTGYIGIDPTANSLHIGHLAGLMIMKHFQLAGHKPLIVVGGATAMIGDPSGKSQERNLLDEETVNKNLECLKKQISKFIDFSTEQPNKAEMLNNNEWMQGYSFIDFIRDVGKHISVNYMMAKDSVKKRLETGMSFTEFSYQLVQGYDFLYLYKNKNCRLQAGGSDQWGNIVTGTELIRRTDGGEAFALTCPLITKSDGTKFGKTEEGNVWLNPEYTSPYRFYQFWLNVSDEDAEKYIKIFTLLNREQIEDIILQHHKEPHLRLTQKTLAKEITCMVHCNDDYNAAADASSILFSNSANEQLKNIDEEMFLSVFEGVPVYDVPFNVLEKGVSLAELLAEKTKIFSSKGDFRRNVNQGGLSINKNKVTDSEINISAEQLLNNKYILVQKGKKNYSIIKCI